MYEDAKLEELFEKDSCQTQEELSITIGVTRQVISSDRLISLATIQKQGKWRAINERVFS